MTQLELAGALNVQQSTISHIETGVRKPSIDLLCKLAETLEVSLDELLGKAG